VLLVNSTTDTQKT